MQLVVRYKTLHCPTTSYLASEDLLQNGLQKKLPADCFHVCTQFNFFKLITNLLFVQHIFKNDYLRAFFTPVPRPAGALNHPACNFQVRMRDRSRGSSYLSLTRILHNFYENAFLQCIFGDRRSASLANLKELNDK